MVERNHEIGQRDIKGCSDGVQSVDAWNLGGSFNVEDRASAHARCIGEGIEAPALGLPKAGDFMPECPEVRRRQRG